MKTVGTKSNRTGIGARIECVSAGGHKQVDEVRSGGSYVSQNDFRVHFGLGEATTADIQIRWPSGIIDTLKGVPANQSITVVEGKGLRA